MDPVRRKTITGLVSGAALLASCQHATSPVSEEGRSARAADEAPVIDVAQDIRFRRNAESEVKVFDGNPVPAGMMMYTVGVTRPGQTNPSCTGTLIESDIVLTAAHCVCDGITGQVYVGGDATATTGPKAGRYYGISDSRPAMQCDASVKEGRDLAVLELSEAVTGVTPMAIAADSVVSGARHYRVAGFGAIDKDGMVYPDDKREARVTAVSNDCRGRVDAATDEDHYGCQPGQEIVAGNRQSPDSCNGDSGGPLLVTAAGTGGTGPEDRYVLAGVTSRAINLSPTACGNGGIYERLTPAARRWIANTIRSLRGG